MARIADQNFKHHLSPNGTLLPARRNVNRVAIHAKPEARLEGAEHAREPDFVPMIEALAKAQALRLPHPRPVTRLHTNAGGD